MSPEAIEVPVENLDAASADPEDVGAKERIHAQIDAMVKEKVGKRIGLATSKKIFDMVIAEVMKAAVQDESLRFPNGYGSLQIHHLGRGTKPKLLPNKTTTTASMREGRVKLRYHAGVLVEKLIEERFGAPKPVTENPVPAPGPEPISPSSV